MNSSDIRLNVCEFCILVRGFNVDVSDDCVKEQFPGCQRATQVVRTANFEQSEREWILQFSEKKDKERYLSEPVNSNHGNLVTSTCDLPCDIPEEWLSDLPRELSSDEEERNSPDTWSPSPSGSHSVDGAFNHPDVQSNESLGHTDSEEPRSSSYTGQSWTNQRQHHYPGAGPLGPQEQYPGEGSGPQPHTGPTSEKGSHFYPYYERFYGHPYQQMLYPGYGYPMQWQHNLPNKDGHGPPQFWMPQPGYWPRQGYSQENYPPPPYSGPSDYSIQMNPNEQKDSDESRAGSTSDMKQEIQNKDIDTERPATEGKTSPEPKVEEVDFDNEDHEEPMEEHRKITDNIENEDVVEPVPPSKKLKVTNLPDGVSEENLINFFENTRQQGGGDVEVVEINESTSTAIISFVEDDAVDRVLRKVPIQYQGVILDVEAYQEPMDIESDGEEPMSDDDGEKIIKLAPPANKLKVTNLPDGTSKENLINFFENTRRYGGGDIEDVDLDEGTSSAIITFEEDDSVERVLKKVPITFQGVIIEVEAYEEVHDDDDDDDDLGRFDTPPQSDSEPEPSCTIEVTGMSDKSSKDSILYYFEGRKGANTDVVKMEYIEKRKMYLMTFENEQGVINALKKKHKVENSILSVRRHIPPKKYPNKVLIKEIPEDVSGELLCNYIEAKTKLDVEKVELSEEDPGKAILTFTTNIDIEHIQKCCKKQPLKGSYVTPDLVPVSNCIIVKGFSDTTTRTTLECYFDNSRKSGVEGVKECDMQSEDGYCLLYFENAKDAVAAARRKHTVEKCQLQVNIYHECLGLGSTDQDGGLKFKPLPPIVVKNIMTEKMKFLQVSETVKEDFGRVLLNVHGKVNWQACAETDIQVESTITKETKNWSSIIKRWEKDIRGKVDDFIKSIEVEEITILQGSWSQVKTKVREIIITDPDKVTVNLEKPPVCKFVVIGYMGAVQEVVQKVKGISDEVVKDLEMKKQQINEDVSVKHFQALILELTKFPEKIKQLFTDVDVEINAKNCIVSFTGSAGSITQAKVQMYQTTSDIIQGSLGHRSDIFVQFLEMREVKRIVGRKMRDGGCLGVWGVQNNNVTMYSTTTNDLTKASDIFKDSVVETEVETEKNQKHLLQSQKWNQLKKSIEDEYNHKSICTKMVVDKQGKITLLCTNTAEMANIREKVADFFLLNAENEVALDIGQAELRFLHENMKDEIKKIENELRPRNIFVVFKTDSVVVKSNQAGVQEARNEVDSLVKKIHKVKHSIDKPGLSELIRTDRGKNKLRQIGKTNYVVICTEDEHLTTGANRKVEYIAAGGQKVIVVKGDITALDVDVIVNAANKELAHSGGLAKALINKGGRSIQDECDKYTRKHGQLKEGTIFCSDPGTLKCKLIIHAVGPVWQGGRNWEEQHLSDCVETSLVEAGKKGYSSIAIPALCTGIFAYPAGEATRVIVESVRDYFKSNAGSSIQTVYLCDIHSTTVDLFVQAGNKLLGHGQGHGKSRGSYKTPSGGGGRYGRFNADHSKDQVQHLQVPKYSTGDINVKVVKGELAKMKVDVIVNTTSRDLRLDNGAVSKSLLVRGGRTLQDECIQYYPGGINFGEVAVTSGGHLNCHMVCHGSLDMWRHDGSSVKMLEHFMKGCLQAAEKKSMHSVAFPAMGTGNLGYPKDLVAQHMFTTVADFSNHNPRTKIKEVLFVVYDKDYETVKAFEDKERKFLKGESGQSSGTPSFQGKPQFSSDSDKLYSVDLGNITLKIYKGDITQAQVEVIVNSSNTELDLSLGAVSKAILKKGGPDLEQQLSRKRKFMKLDGIVVTKIRGSGMHCKDVIHLDMRETSRKLKEKITQALVKTDEIFRSSVAFPALGTSTGNVTVEEAAQDLYSAVDKFQSKPPQNVKEVHVVIFQPDMVKTFMDTIQKCCTKHKGYWGKFVDFLGLGSNDDQKIIAQDRPQVLQMSASSIDTSQSVPVKFIIFAKNNREAKMAVKILESELDKEFITKNVIDNLIKEFSSNQIAELNRMGAYEKVEVNINKSKGEITLTGVKENVFKAMSKTNDILSSAQQVRFNTQKGQLVKDVVEWSFIDVNNGKKTMIEFPADVNLIIESDFQEMKSKAKFPDNQGKIYIVDFDENKMFPEANRWDACDVVRRSKLSASSFTPPPHWDTMDEEETLKRVTLKSSSKEYKEVIKEFQRTGAPGFTIVKVERIQNKTLYQQYLAKKKQMDDTNPPGHRNEQKLWHGTDKDAEDSITKYGFNRSYCGKHATAYGAGVYFAVNAAYSTSDNYSKPDLNGHKRMYYCRVLTGESINGNSSMRVPPCKKSGTHLLYDTTTDNSLRPSMFIIYHDSQAVADYLITFKS